MLGAHGFGIIRDDREEGPLKELELLRHAARDPSTDRLSPEGQDQAKEVGRTSLLGDYSMVFVSPAQRAAETVAWFLQAMGQHLPSHAVVPGLGGVDVDPDDAEAMGHVVRHMLDELPDGGRGLAVSHTPLIERAILGLTGSQIAPLAECEGVLIVQHSDGTLSVEELRLDDAKA
jgi:broad specificity phosphatase PhoE